MQINLTAVSIGGIAANASFPPLAEEEIWQMQVYRRYKTAVKLRLCPTTDPFQAGLSFSFNINPEIHLSLIFP